MLSYSKVPVKTIAWSGGEIDSFVTDDEGNLDRETVESFGEEWTKFAAFSAEEIRKVGDEYFDVVAENMLGQHVTALDVGCGTGRWTKYLAPKVGFVEAIDPSAAVHSAVQLLHDEQNVRVTQAGVESIPFEDESFDFVFSLGVLHHIPDTAKAMQSAVKKLKPGGHFLVYLYYSLDNRGAGFKALFKLVNGIRSIVAGMPTFWKKLTCDFLAIFVYLPMIGLSGLVKLLTGGSKLYAKLPLSYYVGKSWNVIRNDALDRFGTPLEQRFSKEEIRQMMEACGLVDIQFSTQAPFWHAVGRKAE